VTCVTGILTAFGQDDNICGVRCGTDEFLLDFLNGYYHNESLSKEQRKEIKGCVKRGRFVKFIKSFRTRRCGQVERM